MPSLAETIERLAKLRAPGAVGRQDGGRLKDLSSFGADPGNLQARTYIPTNLAPGAALVVVLHGCTQDAAGYDRGAGWSRLADEMGFALLFPEQRRANNPNMCFNWFQPGDIARDAGEAASIRQMIAMMVATHPIDPARIFVTGLSAGGAMTAVMLATYPEVFAGGAVIAGLPYGVAANVPQALERMRGQGLPEGDVLVDRVRRASANAGPWPILSVWHGDADATVDKANAEALLAQWRGLHVVGGSPEADLIDGHAHRLWRDAGGRAVIEDYRIAGMGHGTPLATQGADACGVAGPYMLDAGISSSRHIARFWGLDRDVARAATPAEPEIDRTLPSLARIERQPGRDWHAVEKDSFPSGSVGGVIEKALRAAGLMK